MYRRSVPWTLVTNDDGIDSPALVPLAAALARDREVRVVVPDRERSWVGKAITRYEDVAVKRVDTNGLTAWACSGYPADSVQLGIHGLFEDPPSLVISGINLGYNHGAGFLMSSGTVGAAIEAWVSGIPAIAFSTGTMSGWPEWRAWVESPDAGEGWERLAELCRSLEAEVSDSGILDHADVISVNLPFDADDHTPRRVTTIARVGYDRLFQPAGDGVFRHGFGGGFLEFDVLDGTDVDAGHRGWISITPVRLPQASDIPSDVRLRLERATG